MPSAELLFLFLPGWGRGVVSSSLQMTQADRWLGRALAESHHLSSPPDAFFPTVSMSLLVFMVLVVFHLHSNIMLQVKKKKKSKLQKPGR